MVGVSASHHCGAISVSTRAISDVLAESSRAPKKSHCWSTVGASAAAASEAEGIAASSRVLVADRVVLSHAGWRAWASQRAPLASFCELSGKRLRAEMREGA